MTSTMIDRLDGLSSSTAIKGPVRVATAANIALTGLQTIDGVSLASGDRVLVKSQTDATQNGLYVVDSGPWRRSKDFAGNRDIRKGTLVYVSEGDVLEASAWYVSSNNPIIVGSSEVQFTASAVVNGDQVKAIALEKLENLGDLDDVQEARDNLGLGSAALTDAGDYAPALRGLPSGGITGQVPVKNSVAEGDVSWKSAVSGGGDMLSSAYDPQSIGSDAFDMDNMSDGASKVAMTVAERGKLADIPDADPAIAEKVIGLNEAGDGYTTWVGDTFHNLANSLVLDGSDKSAELIAAVDANKGSTIVLPEDKVCRAAGLYLNGHDYDGTRIWSRGLMQLQPAPSLGATNGTGVLWSGIEVRNCDVTIDGHFDGNRANQQDKEQTIMITVAGAVLRSEAGLWFKELRGDGVYATQLDYNTGTSADPELYLPYVFGENTADDGRNLVSIISLSKGSIGRLISRNIGGVVGGFRQPGGLDLEPNNVNQSVKNLTVDLVDVIGAGSTNFQAYNKRDGRLPANIVINMLKVINTIAANANDGNGNMTQTAYQCCVIEGIEGIQIGQADLRFLNAYGIPLKIVNSKDVKIKGRAQKSQQLLIGSNNPYVSDVENLEMDFDVDDISRYGLNIGQVKNSRINGRLTNPTSIHYSARYAALFSPPDGVGPNTFENSTIGMDIPPNANWTRTYRHSSGMTYPASSIVGGSIPVSGTWAGTVNRAGDVAMPRKNIPDMPLAREVITTNGGVSITPWVNAPDIYHTATITADRTLTLGTTGAVAGETRFRITRTGSGAFQLIVGTVGALAQGEWMEVAYDGTNYVIEARGFVSKAPVTVNTDADFTAYAHAHGTQINHTGTLTAARAVTLSTTNAVAGDEIMFRRTGSGAFNLNIGTGPLLALATNQWGVVRFDGSAWFKVSGPTAV